MQLNPTLWRTCRMLSGKMRLELMRRIIERPDQTVSELAAAMGLSRPRASQELRRLQSRGLVQAAREGRRVRYRPVPDPQVSSAARLLPAMKAALGHRSPEADDQTIRIAQAFSHERRLRIFRELLNGPCAAAELPFATQIPAIAIFRHLRTLKAGGMVRRRGKAWEVVPNSHPLAKCMAGLLEPRRKSEVG
jgi:DNA-binding transcriptional ArsR family regulator